MLVPTVIAAVDAEYCHSVGELVTHKKQELAERGLPAGGGVRAVGYNGPHRAKGPGGRERDVEPDPASIPTSAMADTTAGLSTSPGADPAEYTTTLSPAWWESNAAAICERPALWRQRKSTWGRALGHSATCLGESAWTRSRCGTTISLACDGVMFG
jgi:hypothetical protein